MGQRVVWLALAFMSAFAMAGPPSSIGAAEQLILGTVQKGLPHYDLPILAAEEKGYWKESGLEVKWVPFTGAPMYQAMAAGSVDIGMSSVAIMPVIAKGVPVTIVADMQLTEHHLAVYVRYDSPLKEPKELKGTKVAIARSGFDWSHISAQIIAKGLGLEKQITFVALGDHASRLAALKTGKVDGNMAPFTAMANLLVMKEVRELVSAEEWMPKKWVSLVVSARHEPIKSKPEVIKRTIRGLLQGAAFLESNQGWSLNKIRAMGYNEQAAQMVFESLKYGRDGHIDPEKMQNAINLFIQYGAVRKEEAAPLTRLYTNDLLS